MSDEKVILTAEQAAELLPAGEYVHNYVNPSAGMFIGCDYDRDEAIEALKTAHAIELGGENCKAMKHPLVVWKTPTSLSFFEADMSKLAEFEAAMQRAPV